MTGAVVDFPALPRVAEELRGIQRLFEGAILLSEDFSAERLDSTIRHGQSGIAHIASHGQFATNAAQSFLLTAQGDDRAALAGVAIKAGARSALATLWLVADDAAALLMTEFYRALQSPGMSRARALQQVQHTLLRHPSMPSRISGLRFC
jgi:CHAT domain-containing protein